MKKLQILRKRRGVGFVRKISPKGDGFSAQMSAPIKMNTKAGQEKLAFPVFQEKITHGKDDFRLQQVWLVFDDGEVLVFYLPIWDLQSNFPSRLS